MAALCAGIPERVDGGSGGAGQRGHVEHEVGGVGAPVPGPTVLPPAEHADALAPRRAPHPGQCAPLLPRRRQIMLQVALVVAIRCVAEASIPRDPDARAASSFSLHGPLVPTFFLNATLNSYIYKQC